MSKYMQTNPIIHISPRQSAFFPNFLPASLPSIALKPWTFFAQILISQSNLSANSITHGGKKLIFYLVSLFLHVTRSSSTLLPFLPHHGHTHRPPLPTSGGHTRPAPTSRTLVPYLTYHFYMRLPIQYTGSSHSGIIEFYPPIQPSHNH